MTPFLWLHTLMSSWWATIITQQWERTRSQKSEGRRKLGNHMKSLAAWDLANPGRAFTSYPGLNWSQGTMSHTSKEPTSWIFISVKQRIFQLWLTLFGLECMESQKSEDYSHNVSTTHNVSILNNTLIYLGK